jgi:protocatechuate 3,4-dioxygenase alpha subunit
MSTPSQTVGPYLGIGLPWEDGPFAVAAGTPGAVWLTGVVRDGDGVPVPDALVETWQADPDGRFDHPDDPRGAVAPPEGFRAFARCPTDSEGRYRILTLLPGATPGQAPHVAVSVLGRGIVQRLATRIYFPENTAANEADPVLAVVPPERRRTLIATRAGDDTYEFDVRLQGVGETVFFDV